MKFEGMNHEINASSKVVLAGRVWFDANQVGPDKSCKSVRDTVDTKLSLALQGEQADICPKILFITLQTFFLYQMLSSSSFQKK